MSRVQGKNRSELSRRIIVAFPVMGVVIGTIILSQTLLAVLVLVFGWICLGECLLLIERREFPGLATSRFTWGMLVLLIVAARFGTLIQLLAVIGYGILMAVALMALEAFRNVPEHWVVSRWLGGLFSLFWIGFPLACAVLLRGMHHGSWLVADVVIVVSASDSGAYLGGKAIGRHKMAPKISPKKTWEGWVTGVLTAILAIYLLSLLQSWLPLWQALVFGATVAVISSLGDLFESFMKRRARVKDSGTLFGAHGGALDRADAVLFGVVAGYALAQLFGL